MPQSNQASITLHWVQIPLHEPFRISSGAVSVKDAILIEYNCDGLSGWGEASPMAGSFYSIETPESTWSALETLARAVIRDPDADLDCVIEGEPFAKAGIVGALVDHGVRAQGRMLCEWLETSPRPVPSGVAIGLTDTIDELLERVRRFVAEGYRRVKIKIQPGWDIEPVRRIRNEFPQLPLMVDANASYTITDLPLFREMDRFGLMMYEQPLGRHALEEMAELSGGVHTPVCADESAESLDALERIIDLSAASIINVKIQRVGGIKNAVLMHNRAMEAGLPCWVGTMPELGVASAEAIQLASLPNFLYPTDVESSARWYVDDIVDPLIEIDRAGFLRPQHVTVNCEKLDRYRVRRLQVSSRE